MACSFPALDSASGLQGIDAITKRTPLDVVLFFPVIRVLLVTRFGLFFSFSFFSGVTKT